MGAIITDRFRSILRRSKSNLLSLLSCGALSSSPESRNTIKILGNEYALGDYRVIITNPQLSEEFSKRSCAFHSQIFSLPAPTSLWWIGDSITSFLTAQIFSNFFSSIRLLVRILMLSSFGLVISRRSNGHMWGLGLWVLVSTLNVGVNDSKLKRQNPQKIILASIIPKSSSGVQYAKLKMSLPFLLAGNGCIVLPPRVMNEVHGWSTKKCWWICEYFHF